MKLLGRRENEREREREREERRRNKFHEWRSMRREPGLSDVATSKTH